MITKGDKVICEPWEKGADCGWNQRTARLTLVPILLVIFVASLYLYKKLLERNRHWLARPALCMLCVCISQGCDILEHILVLTEMREHGHDWYANSSVDAVGDIFLMYSFYLFAEIWCDNLVVLFHSEEANDQTLGDIRKIRGIYRFVAIMTVPLAMMFSMASFTSHYDTFMLLYTLWGIVAGVTLLTPVAFIMQKVVHSLPKKLRDTPVYKQLDFMAKVNLYEQAFWNFLMMVTVVTIVMFLEGGRKNSALIGAASVAISISWIIMHLQVVLFFATVTKAGVSSPIFDHSMLTSLMSENGDQIGGFLESSDNQFGGEEGDDGSSAYRQVGDGARDKIELGNL